MRAKDLRPGAVYAVKVSGAVCPVRLESTPAQIESGIGPWKCQNLNTRRAVTVKGARRFRYELEQTPDGKWIEKQPEPVAPLTCAACGLELDPKRCVSSKHTGASYCWPGEGCQAPRPPLPVRVVDIETRLAEADAELAALELEESGQTRIGVAGEQRAIEGLAAPVKPAPLTFERDELERAAREQLAWEARIARDKAASPFFAADDYH